ncbi:hypothetical protein [uncultured Aquimarina sp.]|uniref:hypothetical protein n=1 Tax=uncultured Aquimarina sp. TaxID=575652 RepID=UPI002605D02E|nr:hypothetical protein [uncultured Aquimarina sp.]
MISKLKKLIKDKEKLQALLPGLIFGLTINAPILLVEQPLKPEIDYEEVKNDNPSRFEIIFANNQVYFFSIEPEN